MRAADDDNVTEEQRSCQAIGKLFKCVLFKLGKKIAHEKILLHDDGLVIDRALTTCNSHIFRSIFIHLDFWYKQSIFDDSFAKLEIVQGMWNKRNAKLTMAKLFLGVDNWGVATNLPDGFYPLFNLFFYSNQLVGFFYNILRVQIIYDGQHTRPYSIWNDFVDKACEVREGKEKFLNMLYRIKEELGDDQLKRLLNHDVNNGNGTQVIIHIRKNMNSYEKKMVY